LLALRRDQARSTADVRLQIAQGKIDYTVSGEFHRQEQATPANQNTGNLYGISVSVPLPIFNRNQGEIARARKEEQQSEARVRALEAQISAEVQSAFETYTAARDVVTTIESEMLDQARDVRTTTEYSYRRGEASFIELLDAVRAFNDTMQSYNDARAEYARSLYAIESISGAPLAAQGAQENP
jgi:cobalt-zinc-cadmium efflux system outer membrane protein